VAGTDLTQQHRADRIALRSCAGWAIAFAETPTQWISAEKAALIPAATRAITAALLPADRKHMTVEIARMVQWCRTFGISMINIEQTFTPALESALRHLPADLLTQAFETIKNTHKWGMRPPMPREIAETVSLEYQRRMKIKVGLWKASRAAVEDKPLPPEQRQAQVAQVEAILAPWRSSRSV